jgi:hypothetical protein
MNPSKTIEPLISVEEASRFLGGMKPETLKRKARQGELYGIQLGRTWYFRVSDLNMSVNTERSRTALLRVKRHEERLKAAKAKAKG